MSKEPTNENAKSSSQAANAVAADGLQGDQVNKESEKLPPTLAVYFSPKAVSAASFIKAVKAAKVRRFEEADESIASGLMLQNDANAGRLWALVSQSVLPEAIDRWVWGVVQKRLIAEINENFDPLAPDAVAILGALRRHLSSDLQATDKETRRKSQNLLRIGLTWLAKRRSIDPWDAFEELRELYYSDRSLAVRRAKKILVQGKHTELKDAIAICGLVQEKVRTAHKDRDEERRQKNGLNETVSALRTNIRDISDELAQAKRRLAALAEEVAGLNKKLNDQQQHWGHDKVDIEARQSALLRNRLAPLLNDARDALEIDPQATHVALKRVKSALSVIEEAVQ
jgi:hypothetical protein